MGIVGIILFVLQWLPTAIKIIMSIIRAIKELKDPKEQAIAYNELWHAVSEAKVSGDMRPLEAMKDRCGIRCHIDRARAKRDARRGT